MLRRTAVIATIVAMTLLLLPGEAQARTGSASRSATSLLTTITVVAGASDQSNCSQFTVAGVQHWQCTPILIASGTPQQFVSTGGSISWSGFATCEYRKHADGFNNSWGPWTSCGPFSKSASSSRSWGLLAAPTGGLVQITWPQIVNAETAFATDCVEIRTSLSTSATASSLVETVSTSVRFPSSGTNLSGICEGGSAY